MKQVLFLSGKGGTGKTSLAAAFAVLTENKVLADCDVDAANLHLLLDPQVREQGEYQGANEVLKNNELCTQCGACRRVCRYRAVSEDFEIDPYLCEGCGACVTACPAGALSLELRVSGTWYTAQSSWGPLAGAELLPGEETSGKLVSEVKRKMSDLAEKEGVEWALIDGSPGIGCPVIASVTGVDAVILVTEPTLSGLHDVERALGVVRHFRIPAYLVINKADLSPELSERLQAFAVENDLPILGKIPYDRAVPDSLIRGRSVVEQEGSPAGDAMRAIVDCFFAAVS